MKNSSVTWPLTSQFDFSILLTVRISPTFRFFFLGIGQKVFSIKYLDFSIFFYQFPRQVGGFSLINPPVFFHYLLLKFWRFFNYNYIYATPTRLSKLASQRRNNSNNMAMWSGHLTWHITSSEKFYKAIYLAYLKTSSPLDLWPILNIKPTVDIKPIPNVTSSTLCTQLEVLWVLEPSSLDFQPSSSIPWCSARAYQPRTTR